MARYENDIKILEEDIAKIPVKQAEAAPKASSKTPKVKTPNAMSVPIPVTIPKPTPKPAPTPVPAPVAQGRTVEQIATANRMAEKVGGVVVWQDGDVALIRGYGAIDGQACVCCVYRQ